jgi:transposase
MVGRRPRLTGEIAARPQQCHLKPKLLNLHEAIRAEVVARPDATIAELRRWLQETHKVYASEGLMHATLVRLGLTYKKSRSVRPNRTVPISPPPVPTGAAFNPF